MLLTPPRLLHELAGSPVFEGCEPKESLCCICGRDWPRTIAYTSWQGANFTDQNKLRAPWSDRVCEPCAWVHAWVPPPGHPEDPTKKKGVNVRLFSHFWSEGGDYFYANKANKPAMREWLRAPKQGAWWAAITDSGQKHILPWTPVNPPGARGAVRFEEEDVEVGDWSLLDDMTELLTDGVTKEELETGEIRTLSWRWSGDRLRELEKRFGAIRGAAWWTLCLWLAQRDEDEWKRRMDARREQEREAAAAHRDRAARHARRVPGGWSESAETLGSDSGSRPRRSAHKRKSSGVGDSAEPIARPGVSGQGSLFGD